MVISHALRYVYIGIPRTASKSMIRWLTANFQGEHVLYHHSWQVPDEAKDYLIFTTNKHGFGNFELFIVDVDGRREPVRVTTTDGFDGLPVPLPDGRRLTWTSTRHDGEGGQIYLANWNHEAARAAIAAAPLRKEFKHE